MKKYTLICAAVCAAIAFTSCKSSESAYKQAYLKAKQQEELQQRQQAEQQTAAVQQTENAVVTPLQEKAANVGFDWERPEEVWDKVREEYAELQAELNSLKAQREALEQAGVDKKDVRYHENRLRAEQEFGDLLFSLVNAGRLYKINPDNALERTNQKFIRRFGYVEQKAKEMGKELKDLTLGEMDAFWNEAKEQERK